MFSTKSLLIEFSFIVISSITIFLTYICIIFLTLKKLFNTEKNNLHNVLNYQKIGRTQYIGMVHLMIDLFGIIFIRLKHRHTLYCLNKMNLVILIMEES